MKQDLQINWKWLLTGLPAIIVLVLTLSQAGVSSANSFPADVSDGGGSAPVSAAAAISSQEVRLDADDFAQNGSLTGLTASPAGLTLASGATSGVYQSEAIDTPLAFTTDIVPLWQVELPAGSAMTLETRVSLDGQSWSGWLENPTAYYPVRNDEHSGNLIWIGSAEAALQFRVTLTTEAGADAPILQSLTLVFNDTSTGPTSQALASRVADVAAAGDVCPVPQPSIISRTDWGNPDGQNSPRRPPTYQPVTHIIIHQAETPNSLSPYQDWAGWVRSIWNYHANVLWWGDVGYNYMIDPSGLIYEGRAGGDDVVGIHDTINRGSMSIGFLGCYGNCDDPYLSVAQPSPEMLASTEALMAWKLGQKEIDPLSSAPYGRHNSIQVIAGGRDVIGTSSPGDNLYAELPALRQAVAERNSCTPAPTETCQIQDVIFDQNQYRVGDPINITVRLADAEGIPLGGAKVMAVVEKEIAIRQAESGFDLTDRSGEYDGLYENTSLAGAYRFFIRASDPTGAHFLPCTVEEMVLVVDSTGPPPVTPTPVTPTPVTPTPPPTVTPEPGDSTITFDPASLVIPFGGQASQAVKVKNVTGLTAMSLEVAFDPAVVQGEGELVVSDKFGSGFVARQEIDNAAGRIFFDAVLLAPNTIDGDEALFEVEWRSTGEGTTDLRLENVTLLAGATDRINATIENGTVQVSSASVSGVIALQGRGDHSGIRVIGPGGIHTQTDSTGYFSMAGSEALTFEFPGYLSGQASVEVIRSSAGAVSLGEMTLLAGDVNADNIIDILDMAYLATNYQSTDALADLNGDGQVNILDLALAAQNYGRQGPLQGWR